MRKGIALSAGTHCFALAVAAVLLFGASAAGAQQRNAGNNGIELVDPYAAGQPIEARQVSSGRDGEIDQMETGTVVSENELLAYCMNISSSAVELRGLLVKESLSKIGEEVDGKLSALESKIGELKSWLERREAFLASANETMVEVYQKMRPDAAASQMMELNPMLSAAIVAKLDSRAASAIMMEMKPEAAARITELLASAAGGIDVTN